MHPLSVGEITNIKLPAEEISSPHPIPGRYEPFCREGVGLFGYLLPDCSIKSNETHPLKERLEYGSSFVA